MAFKTFSLELAGRTLSVDIGRVSAQANGAAFMHYGDTTVLSTATASATFSSNFSFSSMVLTRSFPALVSS